MGEKKNKEKKNGTSGNRRKDEWVGKHKVLVNASFGPFASNYFVVNLKENIIEMQHPYKVWSKGCPGSVAVVLENTIIAYQIGGCSKDAILAYQYGLLDDFKAIASESINDHIHPCPGTSKSVLDLKTDPPEWSKWTDCRAEIGICSYFPSCVTLGNKIFAFGSRPIAQVYDTNKIRGAKWEDLPMPSGPPDVDYTVSNVFSDPKNNRLILYFNKNSSLYAYYPDKNEESRWECLNSNIESYLGLTGQVFDDVIYLFHVPYTFYAYDVRQRIWLNVFWPRKKLEDCDLGGSTMIHLGDGMMCLAVDYAERDTRDLRHKFRFRVGLQMFRFRVMRLSDEDVQLYPIFCHRVDVGADCGPMHSFAPF